ncbi:MAG: sigma factor-like helix-turn-helix DNA-binding protein, partial [Candidatus Falkowbacteria bacterium]
ENNNKSILDQIITNQQAEEVARMDAVEIINDLFNELNARERDVLMRRFGLHGQGYETLEKIGQAHNLTRERIRQIQSNSVKKIRELKNLENYISGLRSVIHQLMGEHGGLMERGYLLNNLVNLSLGGVKADKESEENHKAHLDFLISKLLHNEFKEVNGSSGFKNSFKLKHQNIEHLELLADELVGKIKSLKRVLETKEIINLIQELENFKNNQEKLQTENNIDISNILGGDHFEEKTNLINANKILYTILQASKDIEQNKFGYWGIYDWREIKPKTINDKIYLILKNYNKPMHFAEIAKKINEVGFDKKIANAATVHNELILDDKYTLVGRGLYALKEKGYQNGTVSDIVENILKNSEQPLTKEEIINEVAKQRVVKKATINLALMDKDKFIREDGKYKINILQ